MLINNPLYEMKGVFVSSTVFDLEDYRKAVREDLITYTDLNSVLLNEDWRGAWFDDVVERCKENVLKSEGFLGIFAYYYGSIPPNYDQSITHLEFLWAMNKWEVHTTPLVAIFMPHELGAASVELKSRAQIAIDNQDATYQQNHSELLNTFKKEVSNWGNKWQFIRFFKTKEDLLKSVLTSCLTWQQKLIEAAREGQQTEQGGGISDEDLGSLGRIDHLSIGGLAVSEAIAAGGIPGVALVVHGQNQTGHKVFSRGLVAEKPFSQKNGVLGVGRPASNQFDIEDLMHWISELLPAPASRPPANNLDELAEYLHEVLAVRQVVLVLEEVHRLNGGLSAFGENFWHPLFKKLKALQPARPLIMCVTVYSAISTDSTPYSVDASGVSGGTDFSQLLLLPELQSFTEADIKYWLRDMDFPPGEWKDLIEEALLMWDSEQGPDGTPSEVFHRLRVKIKQKWPQGNWDDEY